MPIPSEPPLVIDTNRPSSSWPAHGEIVLRNLQVRYAPHLPLVLRGLTRTFNGGKKTGIVGRTGSGKSTLVQAFFRLVEPAAGHVMIDGIDISLIGLHDLRSRLGIIPQDPPMFEGTLRNNLDPFEEYTNKEIWEALDMCQLRDEVRNKQKKLDSIASGDGENWSMGQRRLVCLARVVLKEKQHFSGCTVLTIAHRMTTSVLDSDMVLLLSEGLIEQYDSLPRLLENKSSSFAQYMARYASSSTGNFE